MNTNTTNTTAPRYFRFDLIHQQILGSELNFQRAGNPNSKQYKELMALQAMQPTFKLAPIAPKKKVEKKTYAGMDKALMKEYLTATNQEGLLEQFNKMVNDGIRFPAIKSWFLEKYPKFDVEKAKREIRKANLEGIKGKYKVVAIKASGSTTPVINLPTAANQ